MSNVEPHPSPSSASHTPGPVPLSAERTPSSRRPLRICHVAYTFYESDNRVRRYAETLAEDGNHVEVIALRRPTQAKTSSAGGIHLRRLQRRAVTEQHQLRYLSKLLVFLVRSFFVLSIRHLRHPYDVVHVHNVPDFLVFAALLPRLLGASVILDIHDALPELYAGKFGGKAGSTMDKCLKWVEKASCSFANHVIIANDIWRDRLVHRAVDANKCTTILNYPDLRLFAPLRAALPARQSFIIVYPGSLNRHQHVDVAIRAIGIVRERLPHVELHVYGEGPALADLVKLTRDLGLSAAVAFKPPLPLDQIARIIASADVGVEPKRAEGFSNEALSTKILEFLACGVPVLASRTAANLRYFDDGVVTFFDSGSPEALAHELVVAHRRRSDRLEWSARARAFAESFSWQTRRGEYDAIVYRLRSAQDAPTLSSPS